MLVKALMDWAVASGSAAIVLFLRTCKLSLHGSVDCLTFVATFGDFGGSKSIEDSGHIGPNTVIGRGVSLGEEGVVDARSFLKPRCSSLRTY